MSTPNVELAEFAARLRSLLDKYAEGNQSALARAVDCTPQAVNKWLLGEQFPRPKALTKIATFFNTTPTYLRYGSNADPDSAAINATWILMYVDLREAEILTNYREGSDTGKQHLYLSSTMIEKAPAEKLAILRATDSSRH